jgi:selenide,water dikinase
MMEPLPDVRLTVVLDRYEAVYSGMVPGQVAGDYPAQDLVIDVLPLARRAGARCLLAAATRIDPVARRIELEGRPPIPYDVASLDVGSTIRDAELPGVVAHSLATRPIGRFVEHVESTLAGLARDEKKRIAIVGGGAAGVELALCLEARLRASGHSASFSLVAGSKGLLPGGNQRLAGRVRSELARRGIEVKSGARVLAVEADGLRIAADEQEPPHLWPADLVVWATGAAPHRFLADSSLPLDANGFVRVDRHLEVPGHEGLFAAGDCAAQDGQPWVPRAGVYAVRQGPFLDRNLRARLRGRPLRVYTPQRDFLALLNLGDRRAVGGKWGRAFAGHWVWRLKDWIDRGFMTRFQVLDGEGRPSPDFPSPALMQPGGEEEMACGGCAAKVGPSPLHAALARLPEAPADASVQLGIAQADDAAAVLLPRGDLVLTTVDAFRAFTDDPWLVGRVAAVNAVSDVMAKGGRARHAMALVTVPEESPARSAETLYQVLAGVRAALDPLGVSLVGGHSTTGSELFVGLSISGEPIDEAPLLRGDGLRPGDALILTKPIGTGVLLAADMRGLARGRWIEAAHRSMLRDNAEAAVAIPALDGAIALIGDGLRSTYHEQNVAPEQQVHFEGAAGEMPAAALLFDPQTSGGLLMSVPGDDARAMLEALHSAGVDGAAIIGRCLERDDAQPLLVVHA